MDIALPLVVGAAFAVPLHRGLGLLASRQVDCVIGPRPELKRALLSLITFIAQLFQNPACLLDSRGVLKVLMLCGVRLFSQRQFGSRHRQSRISTEGPANCVPCIDRSTDVLVHS